MIAEQTTDILVPYGEGNDLISGLNGKLYENEYLKLLRKAQPYFVSVYSGTLKALEAKEALTRLKSDVLFIKARILFLRARSLCRWNDFYGGMLSIKVKKE